MYSPLGPSNRSNSVSSLDLEGESVSELGAGPSGSNGVEALQLLEHEQGVFVLKFLHIHLNVQPNNCKTRWKLFRTHTLNFSVSYHSGQPGWQTAQVWDQRHDGSDRWPRHLWNSQWNLEHWCVGQWLWPQHGWRSAAGNSRWAVSVFVLFLKGFSPCRNKELGILSQCGHGLCCKMIYSKAPSLTC